MRISGYKKILIAIGIMIALIPALGFPASWENTFLIVAGLVIVVIVILEWQMRDVEHLTDNPLQTFASAPRAQQDPEIRGVDDFFVAEAQEEKSAQAIDEKKKKGKSSKEKTWNWSEDEEDVTLSSDE